MTMQTAATNTRSPRWRFVAWAFSMPEVMLALAIFAIGFIAVASVFPVAALLQKRTVEQATARQVGESAVTIIKAFQLSHDNHILGETARELHSGDQVDVNFVPLNKRVNRLPSQTAGGVNLSVKLRSYPYTIHDPLAREYYWFPLVQRMELPTTSEAQWAVYIFVLKREEHLIYQTPQYAQAWASVDHTDAVPGIRSITITSVSGNRMNFPNDFWTPGGGLFALFPDGEADQVHVGDQILDSNGFIHTVTVSDTTGVNVAETIPVSPETPINFWYAPPPFGPPGEGGKKSPAVLVMGPLLNVIAP